MSGYIRRRVRRFVSLGEESTTAFECRTCGTGFERNRQQCPECDGFDIRRT